MNACPNYSYQEVERACLIDGLRLLDEEAFGRSGSEPDLAGGTFDGRHLVEEPIGRGGMGSIPKREEPAKSLSRRYEVDYGL